MGNRHREHPARDRGQHGAFGGALFDDAFFGRDGFDLVFQHIDLGAQGIEALGGGDTPREQVLAAGEFGFGIAELGLQGADLGFDRAELQRQLGIIDGADVLALGHVRAFRDGDPGQRAAEAGPGGHGVAGFDLAEDGLPFGDCGQGGAVLGGDGRGEGQEHPQEGGKNCVTHGGIPGFGLSKVERYICNL